MAKKIICSVILQDEVLFDVADELNGETMTGPLGKTVLEIAIRATFMKKDTLVRP